MASTKDSLFERFVRWAKSVVGEVDDVRGPRPVREDATIRRTRQITQSDCGIAALSMMVNMPYAKARAALFAKGERCLGTDYRRMRRALQDFGALGNERFRRFRSWDAITSHSLVHIQWKHLPRKDPGHWVVLQKLDDGYRVIDPASDADTLAVADISEMRGVSYLPVDMVERKKPRAQARSDSRAPRVKRRATA